MSRINSNVVDHGFEHTTKCWVAKMEKKLDSKKHIRSCPKQCSCQNRWKKCRPWRRRYEQSDQTLNIATVQNQALFPAVKWCLVKILNPKPTDSTHREFQVATELRPCGFQMADLQRDVDNLIAELGPDDARAALAAHGLASAAAGFRIFSRKSNHWKLLTSSTHLVRCWQKQHFREVIIVSAIFSSPERWLGSPLNHQ